ncbi:AN1-type zinc finger protein 4-like [Corticium candelabrum]|uniref:AN1-type zinc finger protein 4-like n=1 Tax=Corticium candelabrum TaxID=121492 RepID=UPI002E25AEF3|nr:AN1-type zinc finger protein 4-like [Corticium candelabrum]
MRMDIFIETLTGNVYELRVSPFETILSVKAKLQRLEDIPIPAQRLLYRTTELNDDCYLHDYSISHGSTLRLVISMRGGPINSSRRTLPPLIDDDALREMVDFVEANPEEFVENVPAPKNSRGKQVTLLVFREGDQLNFFRVFDRGDGTLTPLSESRASSRSSGEYSNRGLEEDEDAVAASLTSERMRENEAMLSKLNSLRRQMKQLMEKKRHIKPKPPPVRSKSRQKRRVVINDRQCHDLVGYSGGSQTTLISQASELSSMSSSILPPLPSAGNTSLSLSPSASGRKLKSLPRNITPAATATFQSAAETPSLLSYSRLSSRSLQSVDGRAGSITKEPTLPLHRAAGKKGKKTIIHQISTDNKPTSRHRQTSTITSCLPPLQLPTFTKSGQPKKALKPTRTRCSVCQKKTGLATSFECRCGGLFCATHRYAEEHKCTFDYKATGRRLLRQGNPVVEAPKLPKI